MSKIYASNSRCCCSWFAIDGIIRAHHNHLRLRHIRLAPSLKQALHAHTFLQRTNGSLLAETLHTAAGHQHRSDEEIPQRSLVICLWYTVQTEKGPKQNLVEHLCSMQQTMTDALWNLIQLAHGQGKPNSDTEELKITNMNGPIKPVVIIFFSISPCPVAGDVKCWMALWTSFKVT